MPSLNFKKQLAPLVKSGVKPHTIRGWRKRPFEVGDTLSFFTGSRFKPVRIRRKTLCTAAVPIEVNAHHRYVIISEGSRFYKAGRLNDSSLIALAVLDGFDRVDDFFQFFKDTHNGLLCGQLIEWRP